MDLICVQACKPSHTPVCYPSRGNVRVENPPTHPPTHPQKKTVHCNGSTRPIAGKRATPLGVQPHAQGGRGGTTCRTSCATQRKHGSNPTHAQPQRTAGGEERRAFNRETLGGRGSAHPKNAGGGGEGCTGEGKYTESTLATTREKTTLAICLLCTHPKLINIMWHIILTKFRTTLLLITLQPGLYKINLQQEQRNKEEKAKHYGTGDSRGITQPSTNPAQRSLTSEF